MIGPDKRVSALLTEMQLHNHFPGRFDNGEDLAFLQQQIQLAVHSIDVLRIHYRHKKYLALHAHHLTGKRFLKSDRFKTDIISLDCLCQSLRPPCCLEPYPDSLISLTVKPASSPSFRAFFS